MYENNLNKSSILTIDSLKFLLKCNQEMFSRLDIQEVYKIILDNSFYIVKNLKICLLLMVDTGYNKLKIVGQRGIDRQSIPNSIIDIGEGVSGRVAQRGIKQITNITKNSEFISEDILLKKNIGTFISLPLKTMGAVIGILNLYLERANQVSAYEEVMLDIFAEQAGNAIQSANLYQNIIHLFDIADGKTKQFIILKEISEALSQQKGLKEILKIIARESLNIVGHGKKLACVMLIDKEKKMLETKAAYGELFREEHLRFHIRLSDQSIVTWVARNAESRIAEDITKDPEYLNITPETKSEICLPLLFRNEVIGVIDIASSDLNAFDEQDLELLQTLADNASIATKIAELYEVHLKQLNALYNTGTEISSSLNLHKVLNTIAREGLKAIGPHNRTLYVQLLDKEQSIFEIKVASGVNAKQTQIGTQFKLTDGISGWAVKNQQHYLCPNVKNDPYYVEINPDVKSELCVPIIFNDNVIGLINVESLKENDFGQYDLQLLQGLANQAGIAIENARLNEGLANTQFQLTQALEVSIIGETLAGLTHDIRTCSSLISGEAQWVEYRFSENKLSTEEAVEATKKINAYVERMERLTDDLNRRSRQSPIKFIISNMADVVRESVYLMMSQALRRSVYIEVDYQSLQLLAEVDARRLKRVFINLIMNAIDAMPNGGILTIKANKNEEIFEINFSDTGIGISKDNLDKVWDSFFTTKQDGSGLGLSVCKRIIESDHNGEINIESEEKKGTNVIVKLPIRQKIVHQG